MYSSIENEVVKSHEIRLFQPINAHTAPLSNRKIVFTEKLQKIFAMHLRDCGIRRIIIVQANGEERSI